MREEGREGGGERGSEGEREGERGSEGEREGGRERERGGRRKVRKKGNLIVEEE